MADKKTFSLQNLSKVVQNKFPTLSANLRTAGKNISMAADDVFNIDAREALSRIESGAKTLPQARSSFAEQISKAPNIFQQASNVLLDVGQAGLGGFGNVAGGLRDITTRGAAPKLSGVSKLARGAGQVAAAFDPRLQLSSGIAAGGQLITDLRNQQAAFTSPLPESQRMGEPQRQPGLITRGAAGFARGVGGSTNISPQVGRVQTQTPFGGVDLATTAGEMFGFVNNPFNKQFFNFTSKILPGVDKTVIGWLTTTAARGGLEGAMLEFADMPEKASTEEKARYMASKILSGAASELFAQGAFKGLEAVSSGVKSTNIPQATQAELSKFYDGVQESLRKLNVPVKSTRLNKNGERIVMPMWKAVMTDQSGFAKFDEFIPVLSKTDGASPKKPFNLPEEKFVKAKLPTRVKIGERKINIDRLDLSKEQKEVVANLSKNLSPDVLKNIDVVELTKQMPTSEGARSTAETAETIAKQLNLRKKVVSLTEKFSEAKLSGKKTDAEKLMLEIAKASSTSVRQGTDIARQLQARSIMADQLDTPMQKVFRLLDNAGIEPEKYAKRATEVDWNNARSVVKFYREFVPLTFGEVLDEVRYTNMLSSPLTHIINFTGNVGQLAVQVPRKILAGGYDWAMSGLTGSERKRFTSEAGPFVKDAISSLPSALSGSLKVLKGEAPITNLDLNKIPTGSRALELYSTPLRMLEAGDIFFKTILQGGESAALRHRASKQGVDRSFESISSQAEKDALETLFRGELYKSGQGWMLNLIDDTTSLIRNAQQKKAIGPIARLTVPFVQTPMNILKQGVEYSPLGFANMIRSRGDVADQLAKATIGSAVMAGAGIISAGGNATWATPTSQKERSEFFASGRQPYSIKIGDKWYSYSKIGPLAYPVAMSAAIQHALKDNDDEQALYTAGKIAAMVADFFTDQSYLQTVGDIVDALKGDNFKQTRLIASIPQQMVPYRAFQGWVTRMIDPIYRKVDWKDGIPIAIAQSMQSQIPFLSQNLPAYRDPFGRESKRQFPLINAINPLRVTEVDPLGEELYLQNQKKRELTRTERKIKESFEKMAEEGPVSGSKIEELQTLFKVRDVATMPESNDFERITKEKKVFAKVDDILDSTLIDDDSKNDVLESLGVSREDAEYYGAARLTNDEKTAFVLNEIQSMESKDRPSMLRMLVAGRKEVNGKMLVTDGVVDEIYRSGLITEEEKKQLKNSSMTRDNTFQLKTSGRGSGSKIKSIKVAAIKPSAIKLVQQRAPKNRVKLRSLPKLNINVRSS